MDISLESLNPFVSKRIEPFIREILKEYSANIHSIHIMGSAVTPDFNEKTSDINSIIVINEMSFDFIEFLAPLGRKHGKKRIASPIIMTPEYLKNSLDVFPIEFYEFKLIHKTVYGLDILNELQIKKHDLRIQCEREIKSKLIGIMRGYISSTGDKELITETLLRSFAGCIPLFRAVIFLSDKEPPIPRTDVIMAFQDITGETRVYEELMLLWNKKIKPSKAELDHIFEEYYKSLKNLSIFIDRLKE